MARRLGLGDGGDGVDSLRLEGFAAYGVPCESLEMAPFSGALGQEVHGILGHPVFGALTLTWDFPAGRLTVSTNTLAADGPGIVATRRNPRPGHGRAARGRVRHPTFWPR